MGTKRTGYQLQYLCEFINGYSFKSTDYVDQDASTVEVFRMGYIERGGGFKEDTTPVFVPREYSRDLSKFYLIPSDITIAMTDMKDRVAILGNTAWIKHADRFALNQRVGCIRVKRHDLVEPRFLYYYSNWRPHVEYLRSMANRGVQVNLSTVAIKEAVIELPSLDEQRSIAYILGTLDDKIELNRQTNQTLEAMAQALFRSWFVDFDPVIDNALAAGNEIPEPLKARAAARQALGDARKPLPEEIRREFPDGFEFLDELKWVPRGWFQSSVGSLFTCTMGQSPPGSTYNSDGAGIPFFQGKTDFQFRFPKNRIYCTEPKRTANQGDTLVSVRAPVGSVNIASELSCLGRGVAAVRHISGSSSFTYYSMKDLENTFKKFDGEGTVFGSINKKDFSNLKVLDFPAELVNSFESVVENIDGKIKIISEQVVTLSQTRDTLLPKLLSGELTIPDAEKLVSNAL